MSAGDDRWALAPDTAPNRPESRGPGHPLWTPEAWALDPEIFDVVGGTGDARGSHGTANVGASANAGAKDDKTLCEVVGCSEKRSAARGAGLCEKHRHADSFLIAGSNGDAPMRWCFYCHRAHDLGAFSSASKSICHEKFTLRQKRRQARRAGGATMSGDISQMDTGRTSSSEKKSTESGWTSLSLPKAGTSTSSGEQEGFMGVTATLSSHEAQTAPHGVDTKFWVAHPRELQERMDMWNLVRRLNSQDEPAGMFGTIVPGCVRLTVRGWRSARLLRDEEHLEHRLEQAFADQIFIKGDVLYERVSVSEMKSIEFEPRRVDAERGVFQSARACAKRSIPTPQRRVFVNANEAFEVNVERDPEASSVTVRFFSEYIDCERVVEDAAQRVVKVPDHRTSTKYGDGIIDHVLSVQVGGYGAAYTHYAIIADDDVARELVALDAAVSYAAPEARQMLTDFAFDYVWLTSRVERAMLYDVEDIARARYINVSARKVLSAVAATHLRATHTLERLDTLRAEIEEIAKKHETKTVLDKPTCSHKSGITAVRTINSAKFLQV